VISAEEYLEAERQADSRSEWHDGIVIRMAGASEEHIDIVDNMAFGIRAQLQSRTCRTATHDLRVKTSTSYVYPDVVVTCGDRAYTDNDCLTNPQVLIEVLSDSTERADRGWKLTEYRNIPSVQEIIHVYQDRVQVDCYSRTDKNETRWLYEAYISLGAELVIASLGITLPLHRLYENVVAEQIAQPDDDPA
jgi:Uma2 family endonuclease